MGVSGKYFYHDSTFYLSLISKDNDRHYGLRLTLSGRDLAAESEAVAREEDVSHGAGNGGVSVRQSWKGGLFTSDS